MTAHSIPSPRAGRWTVLAAVALLSTAAHAAGGDSARARFEQERARCLSGQSHQDRATCLKEANNAYAEARRGRLDNRQQAAYQRNALARCERLPAADQPDCMARVQGQGTVSGSVESGGVYREYVRVIPAKPDAATTATSGTGTSQMGAGSQGSVGSGADRVSTPPAPTAGPGHAPSHTHSQPGSLPVQPPAQPSR